MKKLFRTKYGYFTGDGKEYVITILVVRVYYFCYHSFYLFTDIVDLTELITTVAPFCILFIL